MARQYLIKCYKLLFPLQKASHHKKKTEIYEENKIKGGPKKWFLK